MKRHFSKQASEKKTITCNETDERRQNSRGIDNMQVEINNNKTFIWTTKLILNIGLQTTLISKSHNGQEINF